MVRQFVRRGAIAAATILGLEAAYAVLRPAPRLDRFDPSGEFGDPSSPELRVAVVGDSSVDAPGVASAQEIWIALVCARLAENSHVVLKSFAVGGSKARDVVAGQLDDTLAFRPDVVFVSVGANDVIKGVPKSRFETDLGVIVDRLSAGGTAVVLTGVGVMGTIPRLYPPLSNLVSRRAERFDRIHWKVGQAHGATVIDQRSDDPRVWNRDRSLWAEDYFHVSAAGHARWAETAWRTVGPVLNGSSGPS